MPIPLVIYLVRTHGQAYAPYGVYRAGLDERLFIEHWVEKLPAQFIIKYARKLTHL